MYTSWHRIEIEQRSIMKNSNKPITKTRTQLASEYGIDRKTLYNWIWKSGLPINKGLLSPKSLEIIYKEFGDPDKKE